MAFLKEFSLHSSRNENGSLFHRSGAAAGKLKLLHCPVLYIKEDVGKEEAAG